MIQIIAVSYFYTGGSSLEPRATQVARLLRSIDASVVVFCGPDGHPPCALTAPLAAIDQRGVTVIPAPAPPAPGYRTLRLLEAKASQYGLLGTHLPDRYRRWANPLAAQLLGWQRRWEHQADLIVTFGCPMSDHLVGLAYKQATGLPWIAHFSDPWTDNLYHSHPFLAKVRQRFLEQQVVRHADALVFTSAETVDLVMRKYPRSWSQKATVLPHAYDPELYDPNLAPPPRPYVIRHLGSLYGPRTPKPLLDAVEAIGRTDPALLSEVRIELIGYDEHSTSLLPRYEHARRVVQYHPPVSYEASLMLMQTAHCLLVIDAPGKCSVFFPSKLVDYIGADRYILALSPPGTVEGIVRELGCLVADPTDGAAVRNCLLQVLRSRWQHLPLPAPRYRKEQVARQFDQLIHAVCSPRMPSAVWHEAGPRVH